MSHFSTISDVGDFLLSLSFPVLELCSLIEEDRLLEFGTSPVHIASGRPRMILLASLKKVVTNCCY